jgi:predicted membrane-bound spermidine synthase
MIQKAIGSQIIETRWGTTSRIDLVKSPFVRFAPGLSPRCKKIPPDQLGLIIDGDRMDVVTKYEPEIRKFVNRLPLSIVYQIKKGGSSLIIEGGGGLALVVALSNNMHEIFVVEPEYQILQIVKEKLAEFSGRIYNRLKVKALDVDARTFLKSTDKKFDVIDIALRESIFAVTSGISGLSENYLFTKEAFEQYIKHLKPGGILSLTRWIIYPPRESIRMFTTAYHALKSTGTKVPESHMFMFRSSTTYTLLVKKEPFSLHEIQQINTLLKDNNYQPIWYTGFTKDKVEKFSREYYSVIDAFLRAQDKKKFFLAYPFNVSPIFDNKPFLTNYFRWERLGELERETGMQWEPFFEGAFVIMFVLAQSIILSFVFIFLPMFFHRRVAKGKKLITGLTYFFLIGIGFMLVEIPLLQFFILFLGHPVYAFSVVILSLLVFAGIGSFASNYFVNRIKLLIIAGFVILTCFIIAGIFILPKVLANIGIISLVARFLISIILLAPLGLFMGFPFPTGIRIMGALNREAIPWAWCLNGCASVIGAVLANWLAINFGFSTVLFSGCLAYLLAFACIYRLCHLYAKSTSQTA